MQVIADVSDPFKPGQIEITFGPRVPVLNNALTEQDLEQHTLVVPLNVEPLLLSDPFSGEDLPPAKRCCKQV